MTVKKTILIVDDDPDIRDILKHYLKREDYSVFTASDGHKGIAEAIKVMPDLIIMDIMMPNMDGIEACKILRSMPEFDNILIVFLTGRCEEYSEIAGFNIGADDYITKPLKPEALISRLKAILKRKDYCINQPALILEVSDLVIDKETYLVLQKNKKILLAKKEFELLYLLASRPGKVFTREVILKSIWNYALTITNRTIDVHIRKIRKKIGEGYITTVKGVGYKFEI